MAIEDVIAIFIANLFNNVCCDLKLHVKPCIPYMVYEVSEESHVYPGTCI